VDPEVSLILRFLLYKLHSLIELSVLIGSAYGVMFTIL
jgi:hypothetical protein